MWVEVGFEVEVLPVCGVWVRSAADAEGVAHGVDAAVFSEHVGMVGGDA